MVWLRVPLRSTLAYRRVPRCREDAGLGVGRGADLLLYLLFMLVVSLVLMAHARFRRQDVALTELARAVALAFPHWPAGGEGGTDDARGS